MRIGIITNNDQILGSFIQPEILSNHHLIHFDSEEKYINNTQEIDVLFVDDQLIEYQDVKSTSKNYLITDQDLYSYFNKAKKAGYLGFILKSDQLENELLEVINQFSVKPVENPESDFSYLIKGKSKAIQKVFTVLEKATSSNINVNIVGETGTGKELIAQAVHQNSSRKHQNFVAINVASIPKELIESELFGYEEGAFTGASTARKGKFEEANYGSIFLDEIGELPLELQTKLLRVLQEREVSRIGGNEVVSLDLRIITATHKNLLNEVNNGRFREDLYYRLLGLTIELPPLRERKEDIIPLSNYFLEDYSNKNPSVKLKQLSEASKLKLMNYYFPGNIRQLRAVIELATTLSEGNQISDVDLLLEKVEIKKDLLEKERTLEEYNIEIIEYFLKKYKGKVNYVRDVLKISKSKIYQLIKDDKITR
ncbi:sigma-54-dependent Fis family transcriptional regulator [Flammeovirga sp. MY04]|uniref:sigma-54 interaction domain-containing protein n=1 Tax=Flammeovirga sp. MY04 TaxID=1191459 RepID=UPI000806209B|nr:sigma-54 dependent transcriptional regulator [Flammeovirga sp. MY04]ANQ48669.1 sigma-54-dependent Fis family transcriptional regulator [Flammeovirga sp. MY04]